MIHDSYCKGLLLASSPDHRISVNRLKFLGRQGQARYWAKHSIRLYHWSARCPFAHNKNLLAFSAAFESISCCSLLAILLSKSFSYPAMTICTNTQLFEYASSNEYTCSVESIKGLCFWLRRFSQWLKMKERFWCSLIEMVRYVIYMKNRSEECSLTCK